MTNIRERIFFISIIITLGSFTGLALHSIVNILNTPPTVNVGLLSITLLIVFLLFFKTINLLLKRNSNLFILKRLGTIKKEKEYFVISVGRFTIVVMLVGIIFYSINKQLEKLLSLEILTPIIVSIAMTLIMIFLLFERNNFKKNTA